MLNPLTLNDIEKKGLSGEASEIKRFYQNTRNIYLSAIRVIQTKLDNLSGEYEHKKLRNPIRQIKSRVKTPQSIMNKLLRRGLEFSVESARENVTDIAGIRIICSYIDDIYKIAGFISHQYDIKVLYVSDYNKNPKPNGYRSLHLKVLVPVNLSNTTEQVMVEIQIRTVGMDFWASLEHELSYKFPDGKNEDITEELKHCANAIFDADRRMQKLHNKRWSSRNTS